MVYITIIILAALIVGGAIFIYSWRQEQWIRYRALLSAGVREFRANRDTKRLEELLKKNGLKGKKLAEMIETVIYYEKQTRHEQAQKVVKSDFWDPKGYYSALNLTPQAKPKDIKLAWRMAAMAFHPDKHPDKDDKDIKQKEEQFKIIGAAYRVLGNEKARKEYDRRV